jgi:hypothetical protein
MNQQCQLSEQVREYLERKLFICQNILKKTKLKRQIIKVVGATIVISSITISAVVVFVTLPVVAISILSITSAILTGISLKFNFEYKKYEINKLIEKLNQIQVKLDYVISCNGDLNEDDYREIIKDFSSYLI